MLFKHSIKIFIILAALLTSINVIAEEELVEEQIVEDSSYGDVCSADGLQTLFYKISECAEMEEEKDVCEKNACDRFKECLPLEETALVKNIKELCK